MWAAGNIIIGGLITGAIYALLAVGYSRVFSVSGALNLAQGAFVALGALTMYTFSHNAHLALPLAFLASLVVVVTAEVSSDPAVIGAYFGAAEASA